MIQLHDVHSLHSIDWESKKDGAYVRDSFLPFFKRALQHLLKMLTRSSFY